MLLTDCMVMHCFDNDNEELSFVTLQAATRNVTRYLVNEEPDKHREGQAKPESGQEKRDRERRAYVEQRLRELRAFEQRAGGKKRAAP